VAGNSSGSVSSWVDDLVIYGHVWQHMATNVLCSSNVLNRVESIMKYILTLTVLVYLASAYQAIKLFNEFNTAVQQEVNRSPN
jgi:hypothetical protein